ncbi:MAG TPA: cell division topological specificity factor MinE [Oligoflexia bacterium]|nr:cell division topological specificity factor MinE [Oligoflexia bacterium]HMP26420.1 cell division topological specificity factor MinE [Oligoflexia bacterium]
MFGLFKKIVTNGKVASKDNARSRLHLVLVQDRTGLSTQEMSRFKEELVEVFKRYFLFDERTFDINYRRERDMTTLSINSPVKVRRGTSVGSKSLSSIKKPLLEKEVTIDNPSATRTLSGQASDINLQESNQNPKIE